MQMMSLKWYTALKAAKCAVLIVLSTLLRLCSSVCDSFVACPEFSVLSACLYLPGQGLTSCSRLENTLLRSGSHWLMITISCEGFASLSEDNKWCNRTLRCEEKA